MSEYQYYEFVAIDAPLTPAQMAELRSRSSRATITPGGFVNEYHWGDLKGDPLNWMRRYFDAHIYVANWGTCCLYLRLPKDVFEARRLRAYTTANAFTVDKTEPHWILQWALLESENYERFGDEDGRAWMGRLAPLRDELSRGDTRALYLGWLAGVSRGEVDDETVEPDPPPGLSRLTAAQLALAVFLEIDVDLLAAAASADTPANDADPQGEVAMDAWIASLPAEEGGAAIKQLLTGHGQQAERRLRSRFLAWQNAHRPNRGSPAPRRTVGELWQISESSAEARLQQEAARLGQEKSEREARRQAYLRTLANDFEQAWHAADTRAARGIASAYDETARALADLAEAYTLCATRAEFDRRMAQFMGDHGKRGALVRRLVKAGLARK